MGLFSNNKQEDTTQVLADKLRDLKKRSFEVDDRAERIRQDRTAPAYMAHFLARHSGATPAVLADLERKYDAARVAQDAEHKLHVEEIQTTAQELELRTRKCRMEAITTLESKIRELDGRRSVQITNEQTYFDEYTRTAVDNNIDAYKTAKEILQDGKFKIRVMVEASAPEIDEFLIDVLNKADSVSLEPKREILSASEVADIRPRPPETKNLQPAWLLADGGVMTSGGVADSKTATKELWRQVDSMIAKTKESLK